MSNKSGKSQINTFSGGMNLDLDKSLLKSNQYRYAENVRTITNSDGTTGSLTNIESSMFLGQDTDSLLPFISTNEIIIGTTTIRDIGIVVTRFYDNTNYYHQIYKVTFSLDNLPSFKKVLHSTNSTNGIDMGFGSNPILSMVGRYESDDNIKLYIADGINLIKVINIGALITGTSNLQSTLVTDSKYFDIIPSSTLSTPIINGLGSGRLNAGVIQYCYQLYNYAGAETCLSPLSAQVNLTSSDQSVDNINYMGQGLGKIYGLPTGKSVKLSVTVPSNSVFKRIRLISVYYYNFGESPIINIINDYDLPTTAGSIALEDGGVSYVGEMTIDEFNAIGGLLIKPKFIESKNNILFAANTHEDTWDIENYDTRSYQFEKYALSTTIEFAHYGGQSAPPGSTTIEFAHYGGFGSPDHSMLYVYVPTGMLLSNIIHIGYSVSGINGIVRLSALVTDISNTSDEDGIGIITLLSDVSTLGSHDIINFSSVRVALYDSISDTPIYKLYSELNSISATHDCIHREIYDEDRYSNLKGIYNKDTKLGGSGVNVSYLFTNTYFIESYGDYWGATPGISLPTTEKNINIDQRTARIGDVKRTINSIKLKDSSGAVSSPYLSEFGISNADGFLNYSNPLLANKFKSYQRDEIYRFAAVFYNEKGQKSPAHWISDIRFPAGYMESTDWDSSIFDMPTETTDTAIIGNFLENQELVVKPLGLKFTFANLNTIPTVKRIEIVRAKRDLNNKTVYGQGVVQKTGTYHKPEISNSEPSDRYTGFGIDNSITPHPVISMAYDYSIVPQSTTNTTTLPIPGGGGWQAGPGTGFEDGMISSFDNYCKGNSSVAFNNVSMSPFHYNKDFLLFINPEVSFYKNSFTEQIKSISNSIDMDIVDMVFPMTTRTTTTEGLVYYGYYQENKIVFEYNNGINGGKLYLSSIQSGADITKYSKPFNDIGQNYALDRSLIGMVGTDLNRIAGAESENFVLKLPSTESNDRFDIKFVTDGSNPTYYWYSYGNWYVAKTTPSACISLGGFLSYISSQPSNPWRYNSGLGAGEFIMSQTSSMPEILIKDVYDRKLNSITFKYFYRYSKRNTYSWFKLINQNSNYYHDYTISNKILNIYDNTNNFNSVIKTDDFEYSGDLAYGEVLKNISSSNIVPIGGAKYVNNCSIFHKRNMLNGTSADPTSRYFCESSGGASGPHGSGIIFKVKEGLKVPSIYEVNYLKNEYIDSADKLRRFKPLDDLASTSLSTFIVNLKIKNSSIYGGSSIYQRQFTDYISTGSYIDISSGVNSTSSYVFGGDTYLGLFDYSILRITDPLVNEDEPGSFILNAANHGGDGGTTNLSTIKLRNRKHISALIPLESSINLHIVNSKAFVSSGYSPFIQEEPGVYNPGLNVGSTYSWSQEYKQYDYNSAYSSENSAIGYFTKLLIEKSNRKFDVRIWNSEAKTNNELIDSWSKFKIANYIDLDTKYGQITGLSAFKDRLYFWQEKSFGLVDVKPRSLITDNSGELTLGTGGILTRFDYVSTNNGIATGSINGIAESDTSLYWYDWNNTELCIYNQGVESLSKAKGIQSALNYSKIHIDKNIPMIYDKKYNELHIRIAGLDHADIME